MEGFDGEDLSLRLGRERLTVDEEMHLALSIAEGLAFAHTRWVVHRDLKANRTTWFCDMGVSTTSVFAILVLLRLR
jgi:serine/threonine protein kinase